MANGLRDIPRWVWIALALPLLCFAGLVASAIFLPSLVELELTAEDAQDPWGHAFRYEPATEGSPARLISYGMDGAPGGEGYAADLVIER